MDNTLNCASIIGTTYTDENRSAVPSVLMVVVVLVVGVVVVLVVGAAIVCPLNVEEAAERK